MENYILHELHGQSAVEVEVTPAKPMSASTDLLADGMGEMVCESATIPVSVVLMTDTTSDTEHYHAEQAILIHEPGQCVEFLPVEEPSPDWEMELAEAYVRAQVLEGIFPPEDGLKMGTAFPNLLMPYYGRD